MVFGVGTQDDSQRFNGGNVDEEGRYVPPAPRTPGQVATNPAEQPLTWNTNDTPVRMNLKQDPATPEEAATYNNVPFYQAIRYSNQLRGRGRGTGSNEYDIFVAKLRAYSKSKLGTDNAVDDAWAGLLNDSQQSGVPAFDLLNSVVSEDGSIISGPTGAGPRGVGAYTGPRTTTSVSVTAKEDVKRTLNSFAVDMLGRNLTDKELRKYTAEYREQERGAPRVTTTTPQGPAATTSVTEETVSRETIARNILQDNPMFADNVIKTDVLDMFFNRLGGASSGS